MKIKSSTRKEYYPADKTIYILFDLSNGHRGSHRYLWWFDTYKDAMEHRKHQLKMKYCAALSMPIKVSIETELE